MITQYYRAGNAMVKVVIDGISVTIYDANLARRGVSAEQILDRDEQKKEEWENFMKKKPTERQIADELEGDFKMDWGFVLTNEVVQ